MSKMKKYLLTGISYVLVAALAIGGTFAYLQDSDEDVNVMTLGNVQIEQHEYERVQNADGSYEMVTVTKADGTTVNSYKVQPFTQAKPLYPATGAVTDYDSTYVRWEQIANDPTKALGGQAPLAGINNVIDKFVVVENTGKTDAYVRTIVAIEIGSTDGSQIATSKCQFWLDGFEGVAEIDGNRYYLMEMIYDGAAVRHIGGVLPAGDFTYNSLAQVYLKNTTSNEDCAAIDGNGNGTLDILVLSQAVQTAGFANAKEALDTAFGKTAEKGAEWFGGVNVPVFAPADAVNVDSTTTSEEFAALLAAGKNINVVEDVTIADPESSRFTRFTVEGNVGIWSDEGATLTFGETTTLGGTGTITVYTGSIKEKQELCIADTATIVFEGGEHTLNAFSVAENGKIIVNDGVLNCMGSYAGIMGITFGENGQLIVNGGKLNMYQPINLNQNRCDAAYVEINGGTIDLLDGIENLFIVRNVMDKDKEAGGVLRGSAVRVNGGTFIAHYEIDSAGDATSFIRNGDGPSDTNKVLVSDVKDQYDAVVTGGTFYGSWQRADNTRYVDGNGGYSDGAFVENSIAGFVASGYKITGDATNGYVVSAN